MSKRFRLTEKPHSLKPLSILLEYDADGNECYSHPYAFEIDNFKIPNRQFLKGESPSAPPATADTPLAMVDTVQKLRVMIEEIREFSEIGLDLEAHSYRTYLGITCLIQVFKWDYLPTEPFQAFTFATINFA